jgi:ABC-type lipoprotein release transport system permease subunit
VPLTLRVGWRNLWRNRRRTALTAGGVAFAVFLVVASMCLQFGSYAMQEQTATGLLTGHLQLLNPQYPEDQRLEANLADGSTLARQAAGVPGVAAVAPRVEAFALASVGERSFGAQVLGIDADAERQVVEFHQRIIDGTQLAGPDQAVLGEVLARNLGVGVGGEVVLLGSAERGGVAAMVVTVSGLFRTGIAELDRSLLVADIDAVRQAFDLADHVHRLVVRTRDLSDVEQVAADLRARLPASWPEGSSSAAPLAVQTWAELLPELRQAIEIDRLGGRFFYWIIMILVAFSVVNTFIMTVFERTREFGMLLAIGMRPRRIVLMLQWEALFMWTIGAGAGLALAAVLVGWLSRTGLYLGAAMEQMASEMYMPARLYPVFTAEALLTAPLVLLAGTQLAAMLPSLRIRRLAPMAALRVAA